MKKIRKAQSKSLSGLMRHAGHHERDGGVPMPIAYACLCKRWGGQRTMVDFMEALASDKYEHAIDGKKRDDGNIRINQDWIRTSRKNFRGLGTFEQFRAILCRTHLASTKSSSLKKPTSSCIMLVMRKIGLP